MAKVDELGFVDMNGDTKALGEKAIVDLTDADTLSTFDGETLHLEDVVDENIIVYEFENRPSTFNDGEFMVIQVELDGEKAVLITGSEVMRKDMERNAEKLPFRCKVIATIARSGMTYYQLAPPK